MTREDESRNGLTCGMAGASPLMFPYNADSSDRDRGGSEDG